MKSDFKSPAFSWYPKDHLGSARVAEMPIDVEGYYRRALDFAWLNVGLPADPLRIAAIVGKGCSVEIAKQIEQMFERHPKDDQKLICKRQEIERKKQKENSKKRKESGRKSGEARRKLRDEKKLGAEQTFEQNANKNEHSDSDSDSDCDTKKEEEGVPPIAADAATEPDPVERRIWTDGIALLTRDGMTNDAARKFLGKMAKNYGEVKLASAIAATQAKNPADTKTFLIGCLKQQSRDAAASQVGAWDGNYDDYKPLPPCPLCGDIYCMMQGGEKCNERVSARDLPN